MADGHGGRRKGSGRKPGCITKRSAEIAQKLAAEGVTPIEVMLSAMRKAWSKHEATEDAEALSMAVHCAEKAAPYIHPKLSNVDARLTADGRLVVEVVRFSAKDTPAE